MSLQARITRIEDHLGVGRCKTCDPQLRTAFVADDRPYPGPLCPNCGRPWLQVIELVGVNWGDI